MINSSLSGQRLIIAIGNLINLLFRCGNIAAILELDENLQKTTKTFEASPN